MISCNIAFATSEIKELAVLKRCLPAKFSLRKFDLLEAHSIVPPVDILLLDFTHPMARVDQALEQVNLARPKQAIILASNLNEVEPLVFSAGPIDRIFSHPDTPAQFRDLTFNLTGLIDPDADKKFSRAEYDEKSKELRVTFKNGQFYSFPPILIKELGKSPIKRVTVGRSGHELIIEPASGSKLTVPWDFVRYRCDPGYVYYRQQDNPTLADKIGRNMKAIRVQKNMSAYELAAKTGIKRPNITRIETAKTNPSLLTLEKIASALQVPVVRLLK